MALTSTMPESKDRKFWNRMAARYARKPIADPDSYQIKLDITREYLRPDMRLLEFGCGTGGTAIEHAPNVAHIHAIDVSDTMLDIARDKAATAGIDNVDFERTDIEAYQAPDASYDMVLGLSILHLLKDRRRVLDKVVRLLKPGGVFVSSTVCVADTMRFMKPIFPIGYRLGLVPYVDVISRDELAADITGAGLKIVHQWQPGKGKAVFIVAEREAE